MPRLGPRWLLRPLPAESGHCRHPSSRAHHPSGLLAGAWREQDTDRQPNEEEADCDAYAAEHVAQPSIRAFVQVVRGIWVHEDTTDPWAFLHAQCQRSLRFSHGVDNPSASADGGPRR